MITLPVKTPSTMAKPDSTAPIGLNSVVEPAPNANGLSTVPVICDQEPEPSKPITHFGANWKSQPIWPPPRKPAVSSLVDVTTFVLALLVNVMVVVRPDIVVVRVRVAAIDVPENETSVR